MCSVVRRHALWLLVSAVLFIRPSWADTITGRVVDANGVGIPGIDIDVKNLGSGGDPAIFNDGTDANGFFVTTLPSGVYEVFFKPLPPPTTTLLTGIVASVSVVGTKDLGVITLERGVAVFGRVIDSVGVPVSLLSALVTDLSTGDLLVIKNENTNAFGNFAVAVPMRPVTLDFDPINVIGRTLAPRRFNLSLTSDTDLGDIVLPPGFVLSGALKTSAGAAIPNVDFDVFDSLTKEKIYTPHDRSNTLGAYSMVLASGTYDVEADPTFASRFVATRVNNVPLHANLNVGTTVMEKGVALTGRVRDASGVGVPGIDVDVKRSTGVKVITPNDDTNSLGRYAIVVPLGTLTIGFAFPDQHGTSGEDLHTGVLVSGALALDGLLPRPLANFAGGPNAGVAPLIVTFQDLSTGALTGWSWDFGDFSAPSTLQNPTHTYDFAGTYTVRLTVSGPGGPNTKTSIGFVVADGPPPPAPTAAFIGTPTSGLAPVTVQFTNQSAGIITGHSWNFGDGTPLSTLASPSHVYKKAGAFTVTLTETGPGGTNTATRTGYIVVTVPAPVVAFVGNPTTAAAAPILVAFTNQSTGQITTHLWNFGDGKTATAKSPTHQYKLNGTYTVTLTETGPGGSTTLTKVGYIHVGP